MEGIKGDEGSITVGTTGTISSLMTRELDQISSAPHQLVSSTSKPRISVTGGSSTPKRLQPRKSFGEAGSSNNKNVINHMSPKTKLNGRDTHKVPMLGSQNFPLDTRSPVRRKKNDKKKKSNIAEVVDIKCGYSDKAWASPITNSLKKLGFSKLSESIT